MFDLRRKVALVTRASSGVGGVITLALCVCFLFEPSALAAMTTAPAEGVLERVMPHLAKQFTLHIEARPDGKDYFRIEGRRGHIEVRAATIPTLLFGVNWYLKTVAHLQVSTNGMQLGAPGLVLPAPPKPIEKSALYPWRHAFNQNTDGYVTPYWDEARWRREIDILALNGYNTALVQRGMDAVLYRTFLEFGYTDQEIRSWITTPAHLNWQLMGNMCCFNGPVSLDLINKRAASGRRIVAMLRELGIRPVLQGYYGIVPNNFAKKHPDAHVIEQGIWCGMQRPGWLDPRSPLFAKIAETFYRHQEEVFGASDADNGGALSPPEVYNMEMFQEGGDAADVPVGPAAKAVQAALLRAHPQAIWMTMAWMKMPTPEFIAGVDPKHMLINDIRADVNSVRYSKGENSDPFLGLPWLFGNVWQTGGRNTMGAPLYDYAVRLPRMAAAPGSRLAGISLYTEGLDVNPIAFELSSEMAWRNAPIDLEAWTRDYIARRYGGHDDHAERAWQRIVKTAYGTRAETDLQPQESLFVAQPSLSAARSCCGPESMTYDMREFAPALDELLKADPKLRDTETYRYDLVDVARQVLANESRRRLPLIKTAYENRDKARFKKLTAEWLRDMRLLEDLLHTHKDFLLGVWLARVPAWASSPAELAQLNYDARSILTTWADRSANTILNDYNNREWSGLVADYYLPRWQRYFDSLSKLLDGEASEQIDWYEFGDRFNHAMKDYPTTPEGDTYAAASAIARAVEASRND
ncbi:MAG TPA: alpha-N-acetylglucosaminidase [Paraburkholderia sp.]|uniref:alpha-N-acetylglucosaminidase n=1 Tax=Paraburkholderia sp. TaxID=1926495 RepID=UPI002ED3F2BD